MKVPEHPRIRPLVVKAVLASARRSDGSQSAEAAVAEAAFATLDQSVHACLALMESNGLARIAVFDDGKPLGMLSVAELQRALIAHYESIFTAIELDQNILFLQGTYSC
jgi:CBS domain-containing protein